MKAANDITDVKGFGKILVLLHLQLTINISKVSLQNQIKRKDSRAYN